jgi:GTP-binding protein
LLGLERNIVSDIPGTTRDSIHSRYNKFGKDFILIDTAGLRKKSKVYEEIEFYSTVRAIKSIEESDVCILLIDARDGIQSQDMHIVSVVEKRNKGIIILLNKWDLIDKSTNTEKDLIQATRKKLEPFDDIPVLTISAQDKTRVMKSVEEAIRVYHNKNLRIPTSKLNEIMLKAIEAYHPPSVRGKIIRIKYVTQIKAAFPLFAFFCNHPKDIRDPYKRYLINQLRKNFDFSGTPVKISFRQK